MHKRTLTNQQFRWLVLIVAVVLVTIASCRGGRIDRAYFTATGGAVERGHDLILSKNCGACHTIPGIRAAEGMVGPPLLWYARRTYIAGELPNNTENLVRWIRSPQSVEPNTAMPNLGLSDQQARDVTAYLYTLR